MISLWENIITIFTIYGIESTIYDYYLCDFEVKLFFQMTSCILDTGKVSNSDEKHLCAFEVNIFVKMTCCILYTGKELTFYEQYLCDLEVKYYIPSWT